MSFFVLPNVLTKEERLDVTRLLGHDSISYLQSFASKIYQAQKKQDLSQIADCMKRIDHIASIERTIINLCQSDHIGLDFSVCGLYLDGDRTRDTLDIINVMLKNSLDLQINNLPKFLSESDIVYSVLFNIAKNAVNVQKEINPSGRVKMNVDIHKGFPDGAFFVEKARDYLDFIKFSIENDGEFPQDKPLREYLFGNRPNPDSHGFGLYFVGLVSKVLRTPVGINSKDGKTKVDFYHPIYIN